MLRCMCPHCHTALTLAPQLAGKPFTCPDCGHRARVPSRGTRTATTVNSSGQTVAADPVSRPPARPVSPKPAGLVAPAAPDLRDHRPPDLEARAGSRRKTPWLVLGFAGFCLLLAGGGVVGFFAFRSYQKQHRTVFTIAELCHEVDDRLQRNDLAIMENRRVTVTGKMAELVEDGLDGRYVFVMNQDGKLGDVHAVYVLTGQRPQPRPLQTVRVAGVFSYNYRFARIELQDARILEISGEAHNRVVAAEPRPREEPKSTPPPAKPFLPQIITCRQLVDEIQLQRRNNEDIALDDKIVTVTGVVGQVLDPDEFEGTALVTISSDGKLPASEMVLLETGQASLPHKGNRIEATGTCSYDAKQAVPVLRNSRITGLGGTTLPPPTPLAKPLRVLTNEVEDLVSKHEKDRTLNEIEGQPITVFGRLFSIDGTKMILSSNGALGDSDRVGFLLRDRLLQPLRLGSPVLVRGILHIDRKQRTIVVRDAEQPTLVKLKR